MRTLIATFGSVVIALAIAAPSASAGGFAPAAGSPIPVGLSPVSVVLGDFNGDGKLDAVVDAGTNDVSVLLGDGRGGFSPAPGSPFPTNGNNAFSIAVGDFNLDGKLDAAVTNLLSGSVAVMLGDGTGRLTHAPGSPLGGVGYPLSVVVGDVNSDGTPDAVVANGREMRSSPFSAMGTVSSTRCAPRSAASRRSHWHSPISTVTGSSTSSSRTSAPRKSRSSAATAWVASLFCPVRQPEETRFRSPPETSTRTAVRTS